MHPHLNKTAKEVVLDPCKAIQLQFQQIRLRPGCRSSDYFSAVNILKEPFVLDLV